MVDSKDMKGHAQHVEPETEHDQPVMTTSHLAAGFEIRQQALTRMEAVKENKKPLAWCMYMFFICIMWGFDGLAGGVVVSIAEFRKDFGHEYNGEYIVDADWQLGFQAATLFGLVFGGFVAGFLVNKWGRQPTVAAAYIVSIGGVFLQVFASTPGHFFGGKILTGVPLGCFITVAPTYASEMAPLAIRGAITAGMNFAIVLGQLIGYGVMREASFYEGSRSYQVLFATQWGFAVAGLAILPFFPESPYWLVAHGRTDKARSNLVKLHDPSYDIDGHLAEIHGALAHFMQLAGMDAGVSFDVTVGLSGLMVVGNMCGWFFVEWFGRRSTALWGTIALSITLLLIGVLAVIDTPGALWGQVAFMAVWSFVYQATIGSAAWPISAENPTSRLRAPTQALATMMNGLSSCIWSFSLPYAINPDQGNLEGKIAFVFGSVLACAAVFVFFMIPETKSRTYMQIDELWDRGIAPRRFAQTNLITISELDEKIADEKIVA
ncbi:hypothetical protein ACHAQA_007078 [Verticillium albo-atrum]